MNQSEPFVLLDDAGPGGADGGARLYRDPFRIVGTSDPTEVRDCLEALRRARKEGVHAAGYCAYEMGSALEPRLAQRPAPDDALLWFGLFRSVELISHGELHEFLGMPDGAWIGSPVPMIEPAEYATKLDRVLDYIRAGDIYQANLTFPSSCPIAGNPRAIYARLRRSGGGRWSALLFTGEQWLLSFSPELFFTIEGRTITTRPMKGTAPRDSDPETLSTDPKQRAENLMIVDLLRNDLSRIAVPGSVAVPELFTIETYPTIRQMTSTITATLDEQRDAIDVIEAMFPCGSVTGAPKIRAMEIIREIEDGPRQSYTGSIGWLDPEGNAAFNVAIRTLAIRAGERQAIIGLGSGIVADSQTADEWAETLAKGRFVTASGTPFDLLETLRFDPIEGLCDLERHLGRMKESAAQFGFQFDRHALRNELQAATFRLRTVKRVRIRLSPTGVVAIEVKDPPAPIAVANVAAIPSPVASSDFRLRHKTSDRAFYDSARAAAGTDEVALVDADGFVTEGSFTNIFVKQPDGRMVTPPLDRGLLPGVLRQRLIEEDGAVEQDLRLEDLADGFFIGNSARGLIPARLVAGRSQARL